MNADFDRLDTGFVEIDGPAGALRVAYVRHGKGTPLVLLHGGSGSRNHWIRNIEPLSRHFEVIAPDLPGFGDSGDVPPDIDLEGYRSLMQAAIDKLIGKVPFQLAGFSYGGLISCAVAAAAGDRVLGLTMLAPGGFGKPVGRTFTLRKPRKELGKEGLWQVYWENCGNMMFHDQGMLDGVSVGLYREDIERARFRNWGVSWQDSLVPTLAKVAAPTQMIYGSGDRTVTPSIMSRTARCHGAKPEMRIHIVRDVGHWSSYEAADQVNEILISFHGPAGA